MKSILVIDMHSDHAVYQNLIQKSLEMLEQQGVHFNKVSVHHLLETPLALRFAIETFRTSTEKHLRKPDGYIIFGFLQGEETLDAVVYEEALRSIQDMACYYGLALSHHTLFEGQKQADQDMVAIAERVVFSCLNLIQIKKQLGLHPSHISAP